MSPLGGIDARASVETPAVVPGVLVSEAFRGCCIVLHIMQKNHHKQEYVSVYTINIGRTIQGNDNHCIVAMIMG